MHPLDHPFWTALNTRQSHLARWNAARTAVRIDPDYGPFANAEPGHDAALLDLLNGPEDEIWLVEPEAVSAPGLTAKLTAPLVQMVSQNPPPEADFAGIAALDESHADQMAALAIATKPGPWGAKTRLYGQFYGIFDGERLIAMAGERARPGDGWAEVSGVCTDPDYRGRGLARRLILRVMADLAARGDAAYLHSWAGNAAAIALYEQLGFAIRRPMVASVLTLG
ncbi:GNAT family N-acetyltransferase [Novosphingobium humi]|uniref:GNAT family N-acetyltransferase n=1 Tax=Novosphingobium humi TaxID=2282397 RepID=UPI0025B23D7E|nr:GNAT family N-acetyltransferase [Novosphingobium humi]WJS97470.1 GNAT family N-acetyltransferase [Novosphingobium humi]